MNKRGQRERTSEGLTNNMRRVKDRTSKRLRCQLNSTANYTRFDWVEFMSTKYFRVIDAINSLTAIRVLVGTKNSRPVGFYSRNSTKSTVNPNTTIHKYDTHGGAVCHSFGMGSMDPPDRTRVTSSKGVRGGGG